MTVQFLNLSIAGVIVRFYLMMAVVIIAGFSGLWWIAFLAFPIFISIMLGITFKRAQATVPHKNMPLYVRKVTQQPG
jgi:hypothetical protein